MSKNINIFHLLLYIFCIIPLFKSENNKTEINEESIDDPLNKLFLNYTNVIYLDDSNYTQELNKSELTYLLFYSSSCDFCKDTISKFINTANYLKEKQKLNILFARIEMDSSPKSSEDYEVVFYPTIILIIKGKRYHFEGKKTEERLLHFLDKKLNNDIFKINKLQELYDNINKTTLVFLSTIKDNTSLIYKEYLEFAHEHNKYDYYSCLSEECLKKYGEDIILYKNFDEKENSYIKDYGKLSEAKNNSLIDFISTFGVECGGFLTLAQIIILGEYEKNAIMYVRNQSNEEQTKYDILFKQLGKELRKNNIYTYVSDLGKKEKTNIKQAFSIVSEELPCIFYYTHDNSEPHITIKLYSLRNVDMNNISIDYIKKFIKDVDMGKIKRDLFSQPPSESKYVNGLKYVIGRTYDSDVKEEKKNVFLAVTKDEDNEIEEQKFLDILRNIKNKYKEVKFAYINVYKNEPRDFFAKNDDLPIAYLFTNAMGQKQIIKFVPKNFSEIHENEIIMFLDENLRKIKKEDNIKIEIPKKEEVKITDL